MSNDNPESNKGSPSDKKDKQNRSTKRTIESLSPKEVFGIDPSDVEKSIHSESGEYQIRLNHGSSIYVDRIDENRIPPQDADLLNKLFSQGVADGVFQKRPWRIEIVVDTWLISEKQYEGDTNEFGDAKDLIPVIAEAI